MHTLSDLVSGLQSLRALPWLHAVMPSPQRRLTSRCQAAEPVVQTDDAGDPEPLAQACGWFDSSHALQCGLRVTEHAGADTLANAVLLDDGLDDWLNPHLAGRVAARAVRAD